MSTASKFHRTALIGLVISACGPRTNAPARVTEAAVGSGSAVAAIDGCVPASFVVHAPCDDDAACVRVFEVTTACAVREVKAHALPAEVERIVDLVWPTVGGPLYLVGQRRDHRQWSWAVLDNPRSATAAQLAAMTWTDDEIGEGDPDGFRFGVETDGTRAILTGCAEWTMDSEEEWHCAEDVFRTTDRMPVPHLPTPLFARAWSDGQIVAGVALRRKGSELECHPGTGAWATIRLDPPLAVAPIADDRYYVFHQRGGHRGGPNIGIEATAMKGCARDQGVKGDVVPGPGRLWAHRVDPYSNMGNRWTISHHDRSAPLADASGAPFAIEADVLIWAGP